MAATMRVSIQLLPCIFLHTSFWILLKVWMGFSPCSCLIENMSRSLWKCHERHKMSWALLAPLFLSQGTRLCSVALLSSLQSLQCSLSEGSKRYWYTWTSNMCTFLPSCPPAFIPGIFPSVLSSRLLSILSLWSCSWCRWWFTRWLLTLISVRAVPWWRESFFSFLLLSLPCSLFLRFFFSPSLMLLNPSSLLLRAACQSHEAGQLEGHCQKRLSPNLIYRPNTPEQANQCLQDYRQVFLSS